MIIKRKVALLAGLALAASVCGPAGSAATTTDVATGTTAYETSAAAFVNPERGFYHHPGDCDDHDFDPEDLADYRTEDQISLVMCIFYLAEFKTSPISQAQLDRFDRQAQAARTAGLKMIVRFAYTKSDAGDDATLNRIKIHLDQLAPYLQSNSDVIEVMQSGFVGAWGEGYYTQHFGDEGQISEADWIRRKAVVDKIMSVLPRNRMVQVRTPLMKQTMYGKKPVSPDGAYSGSARARVGHHNDCFVSQYHDHGTFQDPDKDYPYVAADTKYVAMGGETCQVYPPRSECPTALDELGLFHYTYLNIDYHLGVLEGWRDGGCMPEVERRLGYRFTVAESSFPPTVERGGTLAAQMSIRNWGWSTPFNPRLVLLVMRNTETGAIYKGAMNAEPRRWTAGATTAVESDVRVPPGAPAGTYELLLHLADPAPALKSRPEYAIRLANVGLWEPATGFNDLQTTIQITEPRDG